jgi:hypothetical protein
MEAREGKSLETLAKKSKPKAYQSPLWVHLDELRKWRRAQETWEAIADKLFAQYGLKVSFQAVHAFFKRATRRGLRRPLGFAAAEPSKSIAIKTTVTVGPEPDSVYEEAREAIRKEQQSRPKIIKPDRPL